MKTLPHKPDFLRTKHVSRDLRFQARIKTRVMIILAVALAVAMLSYVALTYTTR